MNATRSPGGRRFRRLRSAARAVDALADPWYLAFEAAESGDSLGLQDATLGVNAHSNYDLVLALYDVGVGTDRDAKYADHCAVIDVVAGLDDETQDALADRDADGLVTLDSSLGRFDEWLTVAAIDECRDSAWSRWTRGAGAGGGSRAGSTTAPGPPISSAAPGPAPSSTRHSPGSTERPTTDAREPWAASNFEVGIA